MRNNTNNDTVGASESYRNGKYPEEWAKIKAEQKAEEDARRQKTEEEEARKKQQEEDALKLAKALLLTPPSSPPVTPPASEPPAWLEGVQLAREESSAGDPNFVNN